MALFPQRREIVIVGAGYAGLHAAAVLSHRLPADSSVRVTLLSEEPFFTDRCRLHERCVRERPVRYALAPLFNGSVVELAVGRAETVDFQHHTILVETPSHEYEIPFDDLLWTAGAVPSDYGIPGVREHSHFLSNFHDAEKMRHALKALPPGGRVAIVGGGLTGVELAAEIAEASRERELEKLTLTLLEAAPRILPLGDERESSYSAKALEHLGVQVRAGANVLEVRKDEVVLASSKSVFFDLLVWCAGVRARLPGGLPGIRFGTTGRLEAEEDLSVPGVPGLFAGGDSAAFTPPSADKPLLPKAMWATDVGTYAGEILAARALGLPPPPVPSFNDRGELVSLGRHDACGIMRTGLNAFVSGFPAALMKEAALTYHLWAITGRTGIPPMAE
ncbi:MAG: FAD-dependent oxidoreductase [Bdellovibrionota bacterium]